MTLNRPVLIGFFTILLVMVGGNLAWWFFGYLSRSRGPMATTPPVGQSKQVEPSKLVKPQFMAAIINIPENYEQQGMLKAADPKDAEYANHAKDEKERLLRVFEGYQKNQASGDEITVYDCPDGEAPHVHKHLKDEFEGGMLIVIKELGPDGKPAIRLITFSPRSISGDWSGAYCYVFDTNQRLMLANREFSFFNFSGAEGDVAREETNIIYREGSVVEKTYSLYKDLPKGKGRKELDPSAGDVPYRMEYSFGTDADKTLIAFGLKADPDAVQDLLAAVEECAIRYPGGANFDGAGFTEDPNWGLGMEAAAKAIGLKKFKKTNGKCYISVTVDRDNKIMDTTFHDDGGIGPNDTNTMRTIEEGLVALFKRLDPGVENHMKITQIPKSKADNNMGNNYPRVVLYAHGSKLNLSGELDTGCFLNGEQPDGKIGKQIAGKIWIYFGDPREK